MVKNMVSKGRVLDEKCRKGLHHEVFIFFLKVMDIYARVSSSGMCACVHTHIHAHRCAYTGENMEDKYHWE